MKISKPPKAQENAGDQVEIGVSFAPEWLRKWGEFFVPITGQIPDYFETQLKIFLCIRQSGRFVFCNWARCLIENIIWPGVQRGVGSKSLPSGTTRSRVSYIATIRRKTTFGRPCLNQLALKSPGLNFSPRCPFNNVYLI